MPIANCIVKRRNFQEAMSSETLIELWATASGKSSEHMTVNILESSNQQGNIYDIMATLYLPSLWSNQDVDLLQLGLAKALAEYFNVGVNRVHVITQIVVSGMVVDNGEIVEWQ